MDKCWNPCKCRGKVGQQHTVFDEPKLQDSNETVPTTKTSPALKWELTGITIPVKKQKPPMKWNCAICEVQETSEKSLQKHCAGKKHQSNIAKLESRIKAIGGQKAKTAAEPSPCTSQVKTSLVTWSCSTCQANGTCLTDLEEHFEGSGHLQNIAASCQGGSNNGMANNVAQPQEAKLHESYVPQHAQKPPSLSGCSICQVIYNHESDLEIHLNGKRHLKKIRSLLEESKDMAMTSESHEAKLNSDSLPQHDEKINCELDLESCLVNERHQLNVQALCEKMNQQKNNPPEISKGQEPSSEWDCAMCQAKCNSKAQFEHHCTSKKHQRKIKLILSEGDITKTGSLETAKELPSDGLNSKNEVPLDGSNSKHELPSEKVVQKESNFCEVCNFQYNSDKMLEHHRLGGSNVESSRQTNEMCLCMQSYS